MSEKDAQKLYEDRQEQRALATEAINAVISATRELKRAKNSTRPPNLAPFIGALGTAVDEFVLGRQRKVWYVTVFSVAERQAHRDAVRAAITLLDTMTGGQYSQQREDAIRRGAPPPDPVAMYEERQASGGSTAGQMAQLATRGSGSSSGDKASRANVINSQIRQATSEIKATYRQLMSGETNILEAKKILRGHWVRAQRGKPDLGSAKLWGVYLAAINKLRRLVESGPPLTREPRATATDEANDNQVVFDGDENLPPMTGDVALWTRIKWSIQDHPVLWGGAAVAAGTVGYFAGRRI